MTTVCTGLLVGCMPFRSLIQVQDTLVRPVPPQSEYRVVVMGDQGTGLPEQRAVARGMQAVCQQRGCDLGFGLGDSFYPSGPKDAHSPLFRERFADVYGPLGVPFLMITGNHDQSWLVGGDGADPAGAEAQLAYAKVNPQWIMPARYYRAVLGDLLEVLAVDTTPLASYLPSVRAGERPGGNWEAAQRAWLTEQAKASTAQWTFLLGHHPRFSNAKHGDAGRYDGMPAPLPRGDAVKTLYQAVCGDVEVIFSGHDHALQLFAPQVECAGTWQVVSGAAGKTGAGRHGNRPSAFQEFSKPGFTWVKVMKEQLLVRFYTVNGAGLPTLAFEQAITK